jgi:hypothetical protein
VWFCLPRVGDFITVNTSFNLENKVGNDGRAHYG